MNIQKHFINGIVIPEVVSDQIVVRSAGEGLQLLADLYYQDYDCMILHAENITPDFFDLKTGLAGEILQKFTNFKFRLAIVGDFERYESKSLRDFIFESNKGRQVNFLPSVEQAVAKLSN
ncbi:hypothetical protein GCM10010967_15550 [Dyadobacter beijingensis]|uniref:DUF4180 domain-containing protein n=1 Tax=Dyadobacter beijingensis TaxID=365489 RepID=A0ABQ2HMD4_9BACT|nr:DUF4180 domain-containing protein [Dyadobacter beijingensis]GGM84541.1 hypothetical protein GCM10010967_15550 [Dyadobacter beijingensis]